MGYSGHCQNDSTPGPGWICDRRDAGSGSYIRDAVAHPQPIADMALDHVRPRLYVLNTPGTRSKSIALRPNPPQPDYLCHHRRCDALWPSLSRRPERYLYVVCYGASTLQVIDLLHDVSPRRP